MARHSEGPRYYDSKNGWFANISGDRIRLTTGPKKQTKSEAFEKYHAEMEARRGAVPGDRKTVWSVLNAYLVQCQKAVENGDMAKNTLDIHKKFIVPFNEECGTILVCDLKFADITNWFAKMRQPRFHPEQNRTYVWSKNNPKLAMNVLRRVFRWATIEEGLISKNPLDKPARGKKTKKKRRRPSDKKVAITDAEHELLLEQANKRVKKDFFHLLTFLYRTGARPAEMYLAKANEWDESKQAFVIKAIPENVGRYKLVHLEEDRVVRIPNSLVPLAKQLMKQYPDGPIFRTESGSPWDDASLCSRFKSIRKAINKKHTPGLRKEVSGYSYRHAYVTRWVEQERPREKLCELLQTSEAMLRQNYSHLFECEDSLRNAQNDFDQNRDTGGQSPQIASAS